MGKFPEDWMSNKDVNITPALAMKETTAIVLDETLAVSTETI